MFDLEDSWYYHGAWLVNAGDIGLDWISMLYRKEDGSWEVKARMHYHGERRSWSCFPPPKHVMEEQLHPFYQKGAEIVASQLDSDLIFVPLKCNGSRVLETLEQDPSFREQFSLERPH